MKLNKLILLPLLGLVLTGCNLIPSNTTSSENTDSRTSTPGPGENITSEEPSGEDVNANLLVINGLLALVQTDLNEVTSIDLGAVLDFTFNLAIFDEGETALEQLEALAGSGTISSSLLVDNFNTSPIASLVLAPDVMIGEVAAPDLDLSGALKAYYRDDTIFIHNDLAVSGPMSELVDDLLGDGIPYGAKYKMPDMPVGDFLDDFAPLDVGEVDVAEISQVIDMLMGEARVSRTGTKQVVTYDIDPLHIIELALTDLIDEEEAIDFDDLAPLIDELLDFDHGHIMFTFDADDVLIGFGLDFAFDIIIPAVDEEVMFAEDFSPALHPRIEAGLDVDFDLSFIFNGDVNVLNPGDPKDYLVFEN